MTGDLILGDTMSLIRAKMPAATLEFCPEFDPDSSNRCMVPAESQLHVPMWCDTSRFAPQQWVESWEDMLPRLLVDPSTAHIHLEHHWTGYSRLQHLVFVLHQRERNA